MTKEKFKIEIDTLKKFYTKYCHDKHDNQDKLIRKLPYKGEVFDITLELCPSCMALLNYSFERLQECPHEIKPRCRQCPNPCYEKKEWKKVAKLMRYSGIQLGILKVKRFFKLSK